MIVYNYIIEYLVEYATYIIIAIVVLIVCIWTIYDENRVIKYLQNIEDDILKNNRKDKV